VLVPRTAQRQLIRLVGTPDRHQLAIDFLHRAVCIGVDGDLEITRPRQIRGDLFVRRRQLGLVLLSARVSTTVPSGFSKVAWTRAVSQTGKNLPRRS
jgi:hypothetical protein